MNQQELISLTEDLSNACGACGFEDPVVAVLRSRAGAFGEVHEDRMRNLYCERTGNRPDLPMVQLDAHTDEVSLMVQAIKPNGTLRFLPLGRWAEGSMAGSQVLVRNALGKYIPGVITTVPPHYQSPGSGQDSSTMSIDVGATSAEEAEKAFHIRIGEPAVPAVRFAYDRDHDLMMGKAFDCRLGCAAMVKTLDLLQGESLPVNVTAAWACQEEVGTRGAAVTASRVSPDVAIVFEGCPADDTSAEPYMVQTALKKGPMLRFIDARMITHPRFQRHALEVGARKGIPVQTAVRSGGATNGAPIHLSGLGVPCIVVGIPVRYIHTCCGIAACADLEHAALLAAEVIRSLTGDVLAGF